MVEIFSKREGPRREDVHIWQLIQQNRGLITKLADHLSDGRYSKMGNPSPTPQPDGLIIHVGGSLAPTPEPVARIRVTLNGRIIAVDVQSGRQIYHLGDLRETGVGKIFTLATAGNRYIAPLKTGLAEAIADMDGVVLGDAYGPAELAADIGMRLDIPPET